MEGGGQPLSSLTPLLSPAGHREVREVLLKAPVGLKLLSFPVLPFNAGEEVSILGPHADPVSPVGRQAWWGAGNKGAMGGPPSAPGSGQPPWVESGLSRNAAQCLRAIWRSLSRALQGRASSGEGARASFHCEETLWKEPGGHVDWSPVPSQAQATCPFNHLLPTGMAKAASPHLSWDARLCSVQQTQATPFMGQIQFLPPGSALSTGGDRQGKRWV